MTTAMIIRRSPSKNTPSMSHSGLTDRTTCRTNATAQHMMPVKASPISILRLLFIYYTIFQRISIYYVLFKMCSRARSWDEANEISRFVHCHLIR